jgi:hypothetical protein
MSGETPDIRRPAITPRRYGVEGLPAELRETTAVHAAVEALRAAVDLLDGEAGRDAAAAAWHAASVLRPFCSTYGGAVTGVRVKDDSFVVVAAMVPGDHVIDVTIAVGPDGTCACKVSTADGHLVSAAPDVREFERVLVSRLAEVGVRAQIGNPERGSPTLNARASGSSRSWLETCDLMSFVALAGPDRSPRRIASGL